MTPNAEPDKDFPWWLVIVAGTGLWLFYEVWASEVYAAAFVTLAKGIRITVAVTLVAYAGACLIGLGLALSGLSRFVVLRQAARLYIEVMRGVPIIVLLLYVAFVVAPGLVAAWNWLAVPLGLAELRGRDFPLLWRAVIALTLAYSA
ncbi:MAG: amino acid ABC transporter, partial [Rhodobacterales bacterium 17-64-5]